jgi:hypothetical protein
MGDYTPVKATPTPSPWAGLLQQVDKHRSAVLTNELNVNNNNNRRAFLKNKHRNMRKLRRRRKYQKQQEQEQGQQDQQQEQQEKSNYLYSSRSSRISSKNP